MAPVSMLSPDWMHLFFQSGNWNREVNAILKATSKRSHADPYESMMDYVGRFTFPRANRIKGLLCDTHKKSCKDADMFKCSASEGLTLYPVLCKFFDSVLLPRFEGTPKYDAIAAQVQSYNDLCDVVDLLQLSKYGREVQPQLLDDKVTTWMQSHQHAYGTSLWYLKSHLTGHLADTLRCRKQPRILLACWALERHHKCIRRYVVDRKNTTNLENGLAEDLVANSLRDLRAQPLRDGFVEPHPASQPMVRALVANVECSGRNVTTCVSARKGANTLHRGDVAIYTFDGVDMRAGDILFFASSDEWGECAFITAWDRVTGTPGFWRFTILGDVVRVPVRNLCASATAFVGHGTAQVVCPPWSYCV